MLERKLALTLNELTEERPAMRAIADAISADNPSFGLALIVTIENHRLEETRGEFADAARLTLTRYAGVAQSKDYTVVKYLDLVTESQCGILLLSVGEIDEDLEESIHHIGLLFTKFIQRIKSEKTQKEDRELLVREMRHRTRNSYQLILNTIQLLLSSTAQIDEETQERVERSITALITLHEMFNQTESQEKVTLSSYFKLLVEELRRITVDTLGILQATIDTDENPELPVERATTIGLIVHELIMNSTKHSGHIPVTMNLSMKVENNRLMLCYEDYLQTKPINVLHENVLISAEPLPEYSVNSLLQNKTGIGLKLVEAFLVRARGIRADDGTNPHRFQAYFPLSKMQTSDTF